MFQFPRATGRRLLFPAILAAVLTSCGCERQRELSEPAGGTVETPPEPASDHGQSSHPLVGQAAPTFTAELLDGSPVELEQHAGDVVLLDFWATWCPPCVEALPIVAGVASELRDEGVRFYAVNVGEDAEAVEEFLRQQDLNVPVLMDRDSEVARAYGATAIPQTVLIGPDGRVQAVHVGLGPDMQTTLRQQLRALLSGQDLVRL